MKKRVYLSYFLRLSLEVLVLEAVLLGVTWLLHHYVYFLQRLSFADVLFFMGVVTGLLASTGMMRNPYSLALSPWGVWASSVQATEDEKRAQLEDELRHQTSFGLRMLAVGVIAILLALALTYIK